MKVTVSDIKGVLIRETPVYNVEDNTFLKNLTLSQTTLHPNQCTSGHSHPGLEEVYFFNSGYGAMELNDGKIPVGPGDIVLIPDGAFHKVFNDLGNTEDLIFTCVFQSYEREN